MLKFTDSYLFGINSYDVMGDIMSDIDEVRKRIEKRKKPLTTAHFNKLYNGMIRIMILMIVVIGSMIVTNDNKLQSQIFDSRYVKQFVTFISQSVYSFLPEDTKVSQQVIYQGGEDDLYSADSNQVLAFGKGKVIKVEKNDDALGNYIIVLDHQDVEITFGHLKEIQVKLYDEVNEGSVLATYEDRFSMTFEQFGQQITYQDFQGM